MAVNLAYSLAATKEDTIVTLLSTNLVYGDIQHFFGQQILDARGLAQAFSSETHPRSFLWRAGDSSPLDNLFLMSLPNDQDSLAFDLPTVESCRKLIDNLAGQEHTDYLVVDCSRDPENSLSSMALQRAETILCLHTPGVQSFQWYRSMATLRQQLDLDTKILHLIYGHDKLGSQPQYISELGLRIHEELPWVREARRFENEGKPLCSQDGRYTKQYIRSMFRLVSGL